MKCVLELRRAFTIKPRRIEHNGKNQIYRLVYGPTEVRFQKNRNFQTEYDDCTPLPQTITYQIFGSFSKNHIIQVRLSRATLEFQVLQVPTELKVFISQVIYLISLTKIFMSKKSSIKDLSLQKKVEF